MTDILVVCDNRKQAFAEFYQYWNLCRRLGLDVSRRVDIALECITKRPKLYVRFITQNQHDKAIKGFRGEVMGPERFRETVADIFKSIKEEQ